MNRLRKRHLAVLGVRRAPSPIRSAQQREGSGRAPRPVGAALIAQQDLILW